MVGAQFGDEGDDVAGIERNAIDVGGRALLPLRALAGTWRDGDDAREPEIGPQNAGADHAVMRHDDQAIDLLVAGIGEREHRPIGRAFARGLLHAAHDAVGARRRRNLNLPDLGFDQFGDRGEVDRGGIVAVVADADGFDGKRGPCAARNGKRNAASAARSQAEVRPVSLIRFSRSHACRKLSA